MKYFMIGAMGSGKTYSGERIARELNIPFYDLDEYIEEKENCSIREIFETKGEDYFRQVERKCLRDFGIIGDAVIACGGGTPCFFDNMDWMNEAGITIYLEAPVELLVERLSAKPSRRPLVAGKSKPELEVFLKQMLDERAVFYQKAGIVCRQQEATEDVIGEILSLISEL